MVIITEKVFNSSCEGLESEFSLEAECKLGKQEEWSSEIIVEGKYEGSPFSGRVWIREGRDAPDYELFDGDGNSVPEFDGDELAIGILTELGRNSRGLMAQELKRILE